MPSAGDRQPPEALCRRDPRGPQQTASAPPALLRVPALYDPQQAPAPALAPALAQVLFQQPVQAPVRRPLAPVPPPWAEAGAEAAALPRAAVALYAVESLPHRMGPVRVQE